MNRVVASIVLVGLPLAIALAAPRAEATVYRWRDSKGVLHFSNDSDDVPVDQHPDAVESFTAKLPAPRAVAQGDAESTFDASPDAMETAYERGFRAGMRTREQQLRDAAELARLMVQAAPEPAPAPIVVAPVERQPEVSVSIVRSGERWHGRDFYSAGWYGPSWPVWSPFLYGPSFFGGAFVRPHRFGHRHGGHFSGGGMKPVRGRAPGRGGFGR